MENKTILQEAQDVVYGDRQADYGSATDNFDLISRYWSVALSHKLKEPISPKEIGICMICLKIAREQNKEKRDNLVDIAGYAGTLEKLQKGE